MSAIEKSKYSGALRMFMEKGKTLGVRPNKDCYLN